MDMRQSRLFRLSVKIWRKVLRILVAIFPETHFLQQRGSASKKGRLPILNGLTERKHVRLGSWDQTSRGPLAPAEKKAPPSTSSEPTLFAIEPIISHAAGVEWPIGTPFDIIRRSHATS